MITWPIYVAIVLAYFLVKYTINMEEKEEKKQEALEKEREALEEEERNRKTENENEV